MSTAKVRIPLLSLAANLRFAVLVSVTVIPQQPFLAGVLSSSTRGVEDERPALGEFP